MRRSLRLVPAAGLWQYWRSCSTTPVWTRCLHATSPFASPAEPSPGSVGPLAGIRVLDVGQVVAGNFCGGLLAYFGAEVIKIEPPKGDPLRSLRLLDPTGVSYWYRSYARNKKSVTLDLKTEEGRALLKQLSENVDVVVENFRPGVMERWGLGPQELKESLVWARISGYGQDGPLSSRPGFASTCEGFAGLRHVNGYPDRAPVRPNLSIVSPFLLATRQARGTC